MPTKSPSNEISARIIDPQKQEKSQGQPRCVDPWNKRKRCDQRHRQDHINPTHQYPCKIQCEVWTKDDQFHRQQ